MRCGRQIQKTILPRFITAAGCLCCLTRPAIGAETWTQATAAAAWSARNDPAALVYQDKMWIMGGVPVTNDVWTSTDGAAWTRISAAAGWSGRYRHMHTVFDGRMWVMGGYASGSYNDVWSSTDGLAWTRATAAAPWAARNTSTLMIFEGAIWLCGGGDNDFYGDVWRSTDGAAWTLITTSPGWAARKSHGSVVFGGRMWILGGQTGGYANDVWSSANGSDWTRVTSSPGWAPRRSHNAAVHNGRMWILGGQTNGFVNDVWHSTDGAAWTRDTAAAPWINRLSHSVLVYDSRLWLMAGYTDAGNRSDVWWTAPACSAPVILTSPISQTLCSGDDLTLSAAAAGSPPLTYQWRKNGVGIPGATTPTFMIAGTTPTDSGTYDVEISNPCDSAISDAAVVVVWPRATGDVNVDGLVDGQDISLFTELMIATPTGPPSAAFCAADLAASAIIDQADLSAFMAILLETGS